ncbi:hypothetical protein D3C87_1951690 [compost metagenome]
MPQRQFGFLSAGNVAGYPGNLFDHPVGVMDRIQVKFQPHFPGIFPVDLKFEILWLSS